MAEDDEAGGASPCMAHLLVEGHPVDPGTARDVARFRKGERARLLALRRVPVADRQAATERLVQALARVVPPVPGQVVACYWPIRGEPDLRGWMEALHAGGAVVALPQVSAPDAPLTFRHWTPGCAMTRGAWDIPEPAEGEVLTPGTVIVPLLGVDAALFRLGNGGGFYDRTLARMDLRPLAVGVGFEDCWMRTIFPQPWDVPMDRVVLSDGSVLP